MTARILVVDDESLPRLLLSTTLKQSGYDVLEADGGEAALRLLRATSVDLVLLDLVMRDTDGFQVLKAMKADPALARVPVVVVSGSDDMNSVVRSINMGASDHLSKPFDPALLHIRVRAALALGQLQGRREPEAPRRWWRRARSLLPEPGESIPEEDRGNISAFLRSIAGWSTPYRRELAGFAPLIVVALAIEASLPLGFKFLTDDALLQHNVRALVVIPCILVLALVVAALVQIQATRLWVRFAANVLNDVRFQMFRHLQKLSIGFFSRAPVASLTATFTTDLAAVETTVLLFLPMVFAQLLLVIFSVALLFALEWKLALFAVIGLVVSYAVEHRIEGPASTADMRMKEEQAGITAVLHETLGGQSLVKAFRLETMLTERFKQQMVRFYRTAARASFLTYLTDSLPGRCVALFGLLVVIAGAVMTYFGYLTIGDLVSFQVLLASLTAAVSNLTGSAPHLVRAAGGMAKIERLLGERPAVVDSPGARMLGRPAGEIRFRGVTFGYAEGRPSVRDISLTIPIGASVLVVGPTGSGKSTLLNLLMRFHDPWSGSIAIDGVDLREVTQESLRQHIGAVLQENFLFDTSIRENIRMGRPGATDDEVEAAAREAGIAAGIAALREGYETRVGERGGALSGGMRQGVAVARALIADPPVLLLDAVTSALDGATADSLETAIERIGRGRTVISVTHRLASAQAADLIVVMGEGRVLECGRHDELLRAGKAYARVWIAHAPPERTR